MTTRTSEAVRRARLWFTRLAGASLLSYLIEVNPVPASRPRVSRWGVYYGKTYKAWKERAEALIQRYGPSGLEGPLAAFVEIVVERPKTSRRSHPRGDVDNFAKAALDVLQPQAVKGKTVFPGVIKDDDEIVMLLTVKRFAEDGEDAGTHVHLFPIEKLGASE